MLFKVLLVTKLPHLEKKVDRLIKAHDVAYKQILVTVKVYYGSDLTSLAIEKLDVSLVLVSSCLDLFG